MCQKRFPVPAEMIAAMVEINSDLGVLIDEGIDPEAVESLELLQKRVDTLLNDYDLYERKENPHYGYKKAGSEGSLPAGAASGNRSTGSRGRNIERRDQRRANRLEGGRADRRRFQSPLGANQKQAL